MAAVLTAEQIDEHGHAEHTRRVYRSRVGRDWGIEAIDNTEGRGFFLRIISVSGKSARKYINLNAFATFELGQQNGALT